MTESAHIEKRGGIASPPSIPSEDILARLLERKRAWWKWRAAKKDRWGLL